MRSTLKILTLFLLPLLLVSSIIFIYLKAQTKVVNTVNKTHILGGFSINTPEQATQAAEDGIQVVFQYGQSPSENSQLGQRLQSLHMKVIDGYISSYLYYYECHRTHTIKPPPPQYTNPCTTDSHPELNSESAFLANIAHHLQQVKNNPLIMGYWVLDDWVPWDAGSAQQLLVKVHQLIQQYTPDRPAICGFGGSIHLNSDYGWADWVAANFSPEGCDEVGFYVYASSPLTSPPPSSSDAYDWSMSRVLPAMFASLQQRGWDIHKEPLIGIGQAFGGPIDTDLYWGTPDAKNIETQSKSFCASGATGLAFYAWSNSGFGPTTHSPMNDPEIATGIRNGIAACKQYWSRTT